MISLQTGRYFCYNHRKCQKAHFGIASGRQGLGVRPDFGSSPLQKGLDTAHLLWCAVFCISYGGSSVKNLQRSLYFMCKGAIIALLFGKTNIEGIYYLLYWNDRHEKLKIIFQKIS